MRSIRKVTKKPSNRYDGRINMYAEADYSEGTTANMWICNMILQYAERMYRAEKAKLVESVSGIPKHLTE